MMFNSVKGYPGSRILVGMHASRERAALLLGCEPLSWQNTSVRR